MLRLAPWLLVLLTVLTRLPFMTATLYAFDSGNYALAVRDFYNVAFHQPHPPGYPLYVAIARAIFVLLPDANRALVVEGILLSAIAVWSTITLARHLFGSAAALLAGTLLVFTVGFWGYGEVAYAYVALAAEMATLALLAHLVLSGRPRQILLFGLVWAISLGIRWDGAIFCTPLWLWALVSVRWRLRIMSVLVAVLAVTAFTIPMVQLSGGPAVYFTAIHDYLQVWAPQSAYVVGASSGGDVQATYNLNFLIDYLRQMLGVGILLIFYAVGRRFGPARLATDGRSRFLLVWTLPPLLTYVFVHIGEAGYVLSLAPPAAILVALSLLDLRQEVVTAVQALVARGYRWVPASQAVGWVAMIVLTAAILAWNAQAFLRGVGPGRLPDLRAHDATTSDQVAFIKTLPPDQTLVLSHDITRQVQYYLPRYKNVLLYSEYVPNFQDARTSTPLSPGTRQAVVLDSPLTVPSGDAGRVREEVLQQNPRVTVWVVDVTGATAIEHGYHFVHVVTP